MRVVALITVITASTSSWIRRDDTLEHGVETNSAECMDKKYDNCEKPNLQQYDYAFSSVQAGGEFVSNRTNLERWKASFQAAKTCIQKEMTESYCLGVTEKQTFDIEVEFYSGYLAQPENIDILVNLSTSECFDYPELLVQAESEFFTCITHMYGIAYDQDADLCQAVDDARECIVGISILWCGSEAGDFVESVWNYLVHTESGRTIIEDTPLPAYAVEGCYREVGVVKRFSRALLEKIKN